MVIMSVSDIMDGNETMKKKKPQQHHMQWKELKTK